MFPRDRTRLVSYTAFRCLQGDPGDNTVTYVAYPASPLVAWITETPGMASPPPSPLPLSQTHHW